VAVHSFDPADRNEVVLTILTVFLRQFDRASSDVIDHADFLAAGRDNVHAFLDASDTGVRTLRWATHAGLFLHESNRFLGTLGDLVARVVIGIEKENTIGFEMENAVARPPERDG
jgi:hypothetical protein